MNLSPRRGRLLALAPLLLCLSAGIVLDVTAAGVTIVYKTECVYHATLKRWLCQSNTSYDCYDDDQDGICDRSVKRTKTVGGV